MIPYERIDTLFLDAGNTLVSMDFDWVARELEALGIDCDAESLRRAEAAARPRVSRLAMDLRTGNAERLFEQSLSLLIENLPIETAAAHLHSVKLASDLSRRIKRPGEDYRLWSWSMPGAADAVKRFRALGLRLAVVSNSDGSVERLMRELGFAPFLELSFDSHEVGFEKPDRRFFEHALEASASDAARTLHVGDMYYQDVQGSRAAGLHSVLLDPFGDWDVDDCPRFADLGALASAFEAARR